MVKKESQTIYCDSLIYNQDSQLFSMYGNVRIDDKQRSMQSNKALLDEKTEQITLIENCQINENNKHKIYGDEIILTFKDGELNGKWTSYYSNGQIWVEENYKDGEKESKVEKLR